MRNLLLTMSLAATTACGGNAVTGQFIGAKQARRTIPHDYNRCGLTLTQIRRLGLSRVWCEQFHRVAELDSAAARIDGSLTHFHRGQRLNRNAKLFGRSTPQVAFRVVQTELEPEIARK